MDINNIVLFFIWFAIGVICYGIGYRSGVHSVRKKR